jgi:general secretion pathway protein A
MTTLNDFYGFTHTPFTKSTAAKDLYPSRGHCEVQGRLAFALQDRLPALVTGDVGTGKSTAVRAFAQALDLCHSLPIQPPSRRLRPLP